MKAPMRMLPLGKMSSGKCETTIDQQGQHSGRRAGLPIEEIEDTLYLAEYLCVLLSL